MDTERLCWDTPLDALYHSDMELAYIDLDDGELMHWKYIKREKLPNGKWRYYYDKEELKKDANEFVNKVKGAAKSVFDRTTDSALKTVNNATKYADTVVETGKSIIRKFQEDPANIYDITRSSYKNKLDEIKNSKEWKDIVSRSDSEYVKKNEDGSTTYLIDDYLVDKKHPVLDAIGDIVAGRKVTTHEITKDSVVAGLKDYATTGIELGMMSLGMLANGLTKKFKLTQGSYDDEIETLTSTANEGAKWLNSILGLFSDNSKRDVVEDVKTQATKTVTETVANGAGSVNRSDVEALASIVAATASSSTGKSSINDVNIIEAAKLIMETDAIKERFGSNELYKQANSVLSNLTEDEIVVINMLLKQMGSSR